MTRNQRILAAIAATTERLTQNAEDAKAFLVKTGIYRDDGSLAVEYGGRPPQRS